MKKSIISSLIGLSFVTPIYAAENIELDDVVVTAARVSQPRESVIADVTVIDSEEIQRAGQTTLVELLQLQPGVEISSNGGAGKLSSVFIRGTNSNHVFVLIDGLRVGSATAGLTSFENLPLAQIDRIEILHGPATSLYGQDAIGGVIQIFTKKGVDGTHLSAALGYGSYNTKTADASISGKVADTSYAINVSSYNTRGFSSLNTSDPLLNDKDGYRNLSVSGSLSHEFLTGHTLGVQFFSSEGKTHFDNSFNVFTPINFDDRSDLSQLSYAIFSKNQFNSNWLSTLRLGEGIDKSNSIQSFGESNYKTKQRQYSWQNDFGLPVGTLSLVLDRLEERVKSNTDFVKTSRNNTGLAASYLGSIDNHTLEASIRSDRSSQFGTNNTFGLGYAYKITPNWRISGNVGTAFKAPTFNDLYNPDSFGSPTSNPNLLPERSRNIEGSLRYQDASGSASITIFENKIRNLIVLDPTTFVPFNVDKASIQGVSMAASKAWNHWELKASADIQSPRDETTNTLLARRASRHGALNLSYNIGGFRVGAELTSTSARFNKANNVNKLNGYSLYNLTAEYQLNQGWSLLARANNITNKKYALATDGDIPYNTPSANIFFSVRWQPSLP